MKHKTGFFNQYPDLYDLMIPWEQRLSREMPFFEKIFQENKVKSILDCGCGTGWHTITFAKKGYQAFGLDNSPAMIDFAKQNAIKQNVSAKFYVGDFQSVDKAIPRKVDALICLGNSLAILQKESAILKTFKSMHRALSLNGIAIFQVVNFDRMVHQGTSTLPLRHIIKGDKEYLFIRHFDISKEKVQINFMLLSKENNQWSLDTHTTTLFYYTKSLLTRLLKQAGFHQFKIYGDLSLSPFTSKSSPDFIVLAKK